MLNYLLNPRNAEKDFFDDFFTPTFYRDNFSTIRTDITEKEDAYVLKAELPGYNKEDVKLSLDDGYLKLEATRSSEKKEENEKYLRREIYRGTQSRSFYVGNVDEAKISASFNNGILEISVPKEEKPVEEKTNYITIE